MDFKIRKTTVEDLEQLRDLYKSAFGKDTNIDKMYENFEKLKNNPDYLNYSAVTDENELIGFVRVTIHHDIFEDCKDYATIWSVRSKYKRQGVGTKMFRVIEEDLKSMDIDCIGLIAVNTEEANAFYQSLGYEKENGYFKKL